MENGPKKTDSYSEACEFSHKPVKAASRVIVFGLMCDGGHEFEGWFRSSDDFNAQQDAGNLACPACASTRVQKAIMAPNMAIPGQSLDHAPYSDRPDLTDCMGDPETIAELEAEIALMRRQIREELSEYLDEDYDNVGDSFPAAASPQETADARRKKLN